MALPKAATYPSFFVFENSREQNLASGIYHWCEERFELARGGLAANVRSMEGMRGFAVTLVFLVHYVSLIAPWVADAPLLAYWLGFLHAIGNTGVDLFFVLSGYLIYCTLISRSQSYGGFIGRRIQRIYPTFLAVFVVYLLLSWMFPTESKLPAGAGSVALYLAQNLLFLPGLLPIQPMITVAWSLSYEMFYYLVAPVFISVLRLRHRNALWRVWFFLLLTIVLLGGAALFGGPVRLVMFIAGILLHEVLKLGRFAAPPAWLGLAALILGLLSTVLPLPNQAGYAVRVGILFVSFMVFCLACFRHPSSWLGSLFSWTPMRWLGNMSYSYYLLHGLALKFGFLVLGWLQSPSGHDISLFWLLLPTMFLWTLVPCAALYLMVERPYSLVRRSAK